jgi:hypothetical protein
MSLKYETIREHILNSLIYKKHNLPHRVDGPALIWDTNDQWWYQYGKLHRTNGPALTAMHNVSYYHRGKYVPEI